MTSRDVESRSQFGAGGRRRRVGVSQVDFEDRGDDVSEVVGRRQGELSRRVARLDAGPRPPRVLPAVCRAWIIRADGCLSSREGPVSRRHIAGRIVAVVVLAVVPAAGAGIQSARGAGAAARASVLAGPAVPTSEGAAALATLPDVSAGSAGRAWAVGYEARTLAGPTVTVTDRWNGRSWVRVASPDPGSSDNVLLGVRAVSRKLAWAVGDYEVGRTADFRALILRWNGRGWSKAAFRGPGGAVSTLLAVTSPSASSGWAAGYYQRRPGGPFRTLILRWNGTRWDMVTSPDPSPGSNALYGIDALSSRNAWAVGNYCLARCRGTLGRFGTLILRWNGRRWTRVKSPSVSRASNVLGDVTATGPGDVWATGYSCRGPSTCLELLHSRHLLIVHWNGRRWSKVTAPSKGQLSELGAVAATSAANAWAVGDYCVTISKCSNFDRLRTLILHWNGRKWSQVRSPNPGPASSLGGLAMVSPADAWATGSYCITTTCSQMHTLIAHWNGTRWSAVTSPSTPAAHGQ